MRKQRWTGAAFFVETGYWQLFFETLNRCCRRPPVVQKPLGVDDKSEVWKILIYRELCDILWVNPRTFEIEVDRLKGLNFQDFWGFDRTYEELKP